MSIKLGEGLLLALLCTTAWCEQIAVRLRQDVDPEQFATRHGCINRGLIAGLSNYYLHDCPTFSTLHANDGRDVDVEWSMVQTRKQRVRRDWRTGLTIQDPQYNAQWHLHDAFPGLGVDKVWRLGYFGEGIVTSVIDDGVDYVHPDLVGNYVADYSYDVIGQRKEVLLEADDLHGTPAAGVIAARYADLYSQLLKAQPDLWSRHRPVGQGCWDSSHQSNDHRCRGSSGHRLRSAER